MNKLTPAEQLSLMVKLAANGHCDQFDKGGRPYILHVLKVMHYTKTDDDEVNCIAVGHDLVEDTDTTCNDLKEFGFSDRVVRGIDTLTKRDGQNPEQYMRGILANSDAVRVKLADLRHNTDVRRLKGIREKDLTRMKKYHKMHLILTEAKEWYSRDVYERWPAHRSEMVDTLVKKFVAMEKNDA